MLGLCSRLKSTKAVARGELSVLRGRLGGALPARPSGLGVAGSAPFCRVAVLLVLQHGAARFPEPLSPASTRFPELLVSEPVWPNVAVDGAEKPFASSEDIVPFAHERRSAQVFG